MWNLEANIDTGIVYFNTDGAAGVGGQRLAETGEWEMWSVTTDNTTCTLYLNGFSLATGDFSFSSGTGSGLRLGCTDVNGGNPFNGALSEVYLYNRVLSDAEVLGLSGRTTPIFKKF